MKPQLTRIALATTLAGRPPRSLFELACASVSLRKLVSSHWLPGVFPVPFFSRFCALGGGTTITGFTASSTYKQLMKTILGLILSVSCASALAQSPALLTTIPNPTPETGDRFSWAVAPLGTDRVLVGAPYDGPTNAGAVFLFHTNGTLLATLTNPNPAYVIWFGNPDWDGDLFGIAIAGVGSDRVLVGAPYDGAVWSGRAYLFRTNGTLLATFDTPSLYGGGDRFGAAAAVLGDDRLIISAPGYTSDPDFGNSVGVVYLLSTNGTLLATLNNPVESQEYAEFGFSVAAFGNDRALVGARDAGAAYLFDTNGVLLMTFTNPVPTAGDYFGHSVAAVGSDRVVVGAPQSDQGATNAGVAYVFNVNGALLTTITNPSPAEGDLFGARVAVLGSDRIVISSIYDDIGATNSGAVYVFNADGTLLHTIANPTPAASDAFGARVAALGDNRVIVGATYDDLGATDAGAAYLFSIPSLPTPPTPPSLSILCTATNSVVVSWPSTASGFTLQQNTNGVGSVNWSNITTGIEDDGIHRRLIVNPATGMRFYRLISP